ncbi:MAG TPA: sugar phosphate nucleotidyltransferase [Gemmatimonadota bacterium]|nr:sugar phosphate nucleotidyltransferase [Gemmatimonadota bacterium]
MILAAGLGTRLRPLTESTPKALVEVGGVPMLERIARRLVAAGVDRLIVNVHHLSEAIEVFLARMELGVEVFVSGEPAAPLGTGGGVARAAPLFRRDEPFFLHNVDIVTEADLGGLWSAHADSDALATLAVGRRETPRRLLFDDHGLYGWENAATGASRVAREPVGETARWPFAGIHVAEPRLFERMAATGDAVHRPFSILDVYLEAAAAGERVAPWDLGGALWMEVGNVERLARAREALGG